MHVQRGKFFRKKKQANKTKMCLVSNRKFMHTHLGSYACACIPRAGELAARNNLKGGVGGFQTNRPVTKVQELSALPALPVDDTVVRH